MKKLLRIIWMLLVFIFCFTAFSSVWAFTPPFEPVSPSVYLVNTDTGKVLYEKNADQQMPAGILAQVMTEILVLENIKDPKNETVTAYSELFDLFYGNAAYTADIQRGESLSAYDMMMGLFVQNSFEAAAALAYYVGDNSMSSFVKMMNDKAAEVGAQSTNFTNAYGADDMQQYTTARDIALIAQYALSIDGFADYSATKAYALPQYNGRDRYLNAVNLMMLNGSTYYYENATGMKTGTTTGSGRCLIATAQKDGYNYLLVILGAPTQKSDGTAYEYNVALTEAKPLFQWAFEDFSLRTVVSQGDVVANVEIRLSMDTSNLLLTPAKDFLALIPAEADETTVQSKVEIPEYVKAPVSKGDTIGVMRFYLEGEEIGSVDLVSTEDVSMNQFLFVMDLFDMVFGSIWFKLFAAVVIIGIIAYIVVVIRINRKNRKKNKVIRDKKQIWK